MEEHKKPFERTPPVIHEDYEPLKGDIDVHGVKRNRQNDFAKRFKDYIIPTRNNFQRIIELCINEKTHGEVLRKDKLKKSKSKSSILEELKTEEISPDQMYERIFQFTHKENKEWLKNNEWFILGYCAGLEVLVGPSTDGSSRTIILVQTPSSHESGQIVLSKM